MPKLECLIQSYLDYCTYQSKLNPKTIRAYTIDLEQFRKYMEQTDGLFNKRNLTNHIIELHKKFKPKSVKRKIACLKAFFGYLEYDEYVEENPFSKIRIKFKEPTNLPRIIPLSTIEKILVIAYMEYNNEAYSPYQQWTSLRDICILELLFATGIRVSELCSLRPEDVDLMNRTIRILGKGAKERNLQIGNDDVRNILIEYRRRFAKDIERCGYLFVNRIGNRFSEASVRFMINKYVKKAAIPLHITPHMFRHSFATLLLEEDVDIRYIQKFLGHSSITTTQVYTHVTSEKQRYILTEKHPRNKIKICT